MSTSTEATTTPGMAAVTPAGWVAGTWTIDPAHTTVGFAVRHLMSRVRGTFAEVSGQIVTAEDPLPCSVSTVIALSSVSTGNDMRDNHLRSADFFDVERHPEMTFTSTALRPADGAWILFGDLTIGGYHPAGRAGSGVPRHRSERAAGGDAMSLDGRAGGWRWAWCAGAPRRAIPACRH